MPFILLSEPGKMIMHYLYDMKFEIHLVRYLGVSFDQGLRSSIQYQWSTLSNLPLMSKNIVLALRPATCASWTPCLREILALNLAFWGRLPVCLVEFRSFALANLITRWFIMRLAIFENVCINAITL